MLLNRYVMKNVEVNKIKDVFNPYSIKHTRKLNFFTVGTLLGFYDGEYPLKHKVKLSNYVT